MTASAREVLEASYEPALVRELLESYGEAKRNYYLGGHRLNAVEGGRFCEAAYRILESMTTGSYTALGDSLDTKGIEGRLSSMRSNSFPKSVRIYLPRVLRVVYDIRNSRDAAHLGDGIDPNLQDATLVASVLDWTVAEFVRLSGRVDASLAQKMVQDLVTRRYPVIQTFGDHPKVLRSDLRAGEFVLVLLYHVGAHGVVLSDLVQWVNESMRKNIRRTIRSLDEKAFVHAGDYRITITWAGEREVERRHLLEPSSSGDG
ncbi:hypothetical protein [Amycolatopsis sp. NPDC003676]